MAQFITLNPGALAELRTIDPCLVSYNIEMTEITGGTFWKSYTPEQRAGTEDFPHLQKLADDPTSMAELMQYYPPIDLYSEKLRGLAKELGTAWVRISGSWATTTYYDFDGHTGGRPPEGYRAVLSKAQWIGVLDFVRAIGAKLLISLANCAGLHAHDEPWNPSQAEQIFALSKEYGVPIDAAEFMNEPNMLEMSGAPKGYTGADFARDQDLFFAWVRKHYPGVLCVGPCSAGAGDNKDSGGIASLLPDCPIDELMAGTIEPLDVYSYHCYNGISERLASMLPAMHWPADQAHTDAYLAVAGATAMLHLPYRDRYCPGGQMWVTEAGDAGGGGDTWASTYLDVLRTLNEFGSFAKLTDGIVFHNTLASSDYGYLAHGTFTPRPSYFAALLWNRLMGTTVYDAAEPTREGAHVFAHSRRDGKEGIAYLVINNSMSDATTVQLPGTAEVYCLTASFPRAETMQCNGVELVLGEGNALPAIEPVRSEGTLELPPMSCTFVLV